MAYARFFRLLALLALLALLGISTTWLVQDWFPTGNDEITHLQNAVNVASELAESPVQGLRDAWMGRYQGEERYAYWPGAAYLATAPMAWFGGLRAPLFALLPALLILLWAVGTGANQLDRRLPNAAKLGSVAAVEKRLGVGRKAAVLLEDAHHAAAWRAVLLALLPTLVLLEFRHYTLAPFVACLAATATTLLVMSNGFRHRAFALAWGLCVGLGLMADRSTMVFLVWAPLIVGLLQPGERKKRLPNQAMALAIPVVMAGLFYWHWWQAWGGRIASGEASDPMAALMRLVDLCAWIPLQGFGLVASLLLVLGLAGLAVRRPGWDAGFVCWVAALISPLPLLALTEDGQGGLAVFLVAPLAVLAGVGWGRSRVHTSAAGTTVLTLGTVLALVGHAVSSGLVPVDLGPVTPLTDRQGEPRDDTDQAALAWLEHERGAGVLDLVQGKGTWAGHWAYYLQTVQRPDLDVDWPVRRLHAAYQPGRFVEDPCGIGHLLVIHHEDPWFAAGEVGRPTGFVGMSDEQREQWQQAIALARRCYTVDRVTPAPMGARLTYLQRRDEVADLLGVQARLPSQEPVEGGAAAIYPAVDLSPSTLEAVPEGASCPEDMALIPGGTYKLGPEPDAEPMAHYFTAPRMARIGPFCMDVWEYPNQEGVLPKTNVTWEEARLACGARGRRLCSVDEWEAACRGAEGRRFSYGTEYEPERCYTENAPYFDTRALEPAGSFPDCVSPEGVHDLNGSASEWVDAERPGPPSRKTPPRETSPATKSSGAPCGAPPTARTARAATGTPWATARTTTGSVAARRWIYPETARDKHR